MTELDSHTDHTDAPNSDPAGAVLDLTVDDVLSERALVLQDLLEQARTHAESGTTEKTRALYDHYWKAFVSWCEVHGPQPLPAEPRIVAAYLTDLANRGLKAATLDFVLVVISRAHKLKGHVSPSAHAVVREARKSIRRQIGTAQTQKSALLTEDLRKVLQLLPVTLQGTRDKAILLLGFMGGFRRSELVNLTVDDIEFVSEGLRVTIRKSKTDQEAKGRTIGIPKGRFQDACPSYALNRWLQESRIRSGPLFRGITKHGEIRDRKMDGGSIARIVKRSVKRAGFDESQFAGHSLRAGFATSAARAGAPDRHIAKQTGHRSKVVLERYIREGRLFEENAAALLDI